MMMMQTRQNLHSPIQCAHPGQLTMIHLIQISPIVGGDNKKVPA